MAKKSHVTPRGELVRLARELKIHPNAHNPDEHRRLMNVIDEAQEANDSAQYLRDYAAKLAPASQPAVSVQTIAEVDTLLPPVQASLRPPVLPLQIAEPIVEPPAAAVLQSSESANPAAATFVLELPDLAAIPFDRGRDKGGIDSISLFKHPLARKTLWALRQHLRSGENRLGTGKPVQSPEDVIVWLLNSIGKAAGIEVVDQ